MHEVFPEKNRTKTKAKFFKSRRKRKRREDVGVISKKLTEKRKSR